MNFFDHKDLGNHLLQLCPKVVKHPVEGRTLRCIVKCSESDLTLLDQFNDYGKCVTADIVLSSSVGVTFP